jgi:DMSO/TMAO reductase YedYZ molybdopterin-dependent catalytic subunit
MKNKLSMQWTKRILPFYIVVIFLLSCQPTVPSNQAIKTAPGNSIVLNINHVTPDTPSPSATMAPVATQSPAIGTKSNTPQPNEAITSPSQETRPGTCQLAPVTQPPFPVSRYYPNELDQEYGLHITGIAQKIDLATYRLQVTGMVDQPLSLTYDDIRCMPSVTDNPDLVCPGVFTDYASWTGVSINYILELAGVQPGATNLILVSADGYQVRLPIETASEDKNFLAYEVNGKILPVQHGFPIRAVFPDMWGSYWLKWLVEIRIN